MFWKKCLESILREKKKIRTNPTKSDALSVKGLAILKLNTPPFYEIRKRDYQWPGLIRIVKVKREFANRVMSFTRKYEPKSESSDDYMIKEELDATYGLLYTKWEEACMTIENQKRTISALNKEKEKLTFTITSMEEEVTLLNSKIEHMTKSMCMLNTGYDMLDNILDIGETKVIGLDYNKKVQIPLNKRFDKSKN